MSIEKSQIKMHMAYEIGIRLDDVLESAEKTETRLVAVPEWLRKAESAVALLHAEIDKDCGEDAGMATRLKSIVTRAQTKLMAVANQAENEHRVAMGRISGLKIAVEVTKRSHDEEGAKMARTQEAEAAALEAGRALGERLPPLKAQRLAETEKLTEMVNTNKSKLKKSGSRRGKNTQ